MKDIIKDIIKDTQLINDIGDNLDFNNKEDILFSIIGLCTLLIELERRDRYEM